MSVHERYQTYQRDQRAFFDDLIEEEWDSYESAEWDQIREFEIKGIFDRVRPKTVLDIGCGCGFHDRAMASYDFVEHVDGIDYSLKSVEKANVEYAHPKVSRWVSDLERDNPVRRYDLVVSFQVFEHLEATESYFRFCRTACAPQGSIAIVMPNTNRLPNLIRRLKGQPAVLLDPQHFHEYSFKEMRSLARKYGFAVTHEFGYGLNGLAVIDRLPIAKRLALGSRVSAIANGMCVIMRPMNEGT